MKSLHLVVPGLLGPFADELPAYVQQQLKQPEFALINKYLSKADVQTVPVSSYFETLVHLINQKNTKSLCQLTAKTDGIDTSDGYFYRADPVHFKAESDHAVLIGTELLLPEKKEVEQLVEQFNQHFFEDGISLFFNDANRWYLKSVKALKLTFTPLDYAMGRDIKHFMPEGEDALWWRKTLNEAQMLFFQHEVNESRESNGKLSINGLWLWDDKNKLNEEESVSIEQVYANDVVSISLARQKSVGVCSAEKMTEVNSSAVVVLENIYQSVCYGDVDAWLSDVSLFCQKEFKIVTDLLLSKKVDAINIYPCNGQVFKIDRRDLLRFWKKTKTMNDFFDVDDRVAN